MIFKSLDTKGALLRRFLCGSLSYHNMIVLARWLGCHPYIPPKDRKCHMGLVKQGVMQLTNNSNRGPLDIHSFLWCLEQTSYLSQLRLYNRLLQETSHD